MLSTLCEDELTSSCLSPVLPKESLDICVTQGHEFYNYKKEQRISKSSMEGTFLVAAVLSLATYRAIRNKSRAMAIDLMDFTIPETILLHTVFPHAQSVIARVRRHVLARPEDVEQA